MTAYEYKVVPAPTKGRKARGVSGAEGRFAHAVETLMNEMGADGWEYLRADTLPHEERQGLSGTQMTYRTLLVFRRPRAGDMEAFQPRLLDPPEAAAPALLPAEAAQADAPSTETPVAAPSRAALSRSEPQASRVRRAVLAARSRVGEPVPGLAVSKPLRTHAHTVMLSETLAAPQGTPEPAETPRPENGQPAPALADAPAVATSAPTERLAEPQPDAHPRPEQADGDATAAKAPNRDTVPEASDPAPGETEEDTTPVNSVTSILQARAARLLSGRETG